RSPRRLQRPSPTRIASNAPRGPMSLPVTRIASPSPARPRRRAPAPGLCAALLCGLLCACGDRQAATPRDAEAEALPAPAVEGAVTGTPQPGVAGIPSLGEGPPATLPTPEELGIADAANPETGL